MLKPFMMTLGLIVALCSCSKSDDAGTTNTPAPLENAVQSSTDPTENDIDDTAQLPASEPEKSAEKAATETEPKEDRKPSPDAAHDRAKPARSPTARRWDQFQAAMERCVAVTLTAREQCLAEARDAYRSANIDCAALPRRERQQCLQYAKLWEDVETDEPTAAVTHDEEPATAPTSPGDTRPAERNRDSTKQQQDAVGTLPEPATPN